MAIHQTFSFAAPFRGAAVESAMSNRSKRGGGIPETLKETVPAREAAPRARRTAAFASSDPTIRERTLPDGTELPGGLIVAGRFRLKAHGAGMEVVDMETGRQVPFPKSATGVVQSLLQGLFGRTGRKADAADDGMPERLSFDEDGLPHLVLTRETLRVDPKHPTRLVDEDFEGALEVTAYRVTYRDEDKGHVFVFGPNRVQVSVPEMQNKITVHVGLHAGVRRVRDLALLAERRLGAPAPLLRGPTA